MDALSQSETVSTIGQHEARWNPHFIRWTSIPSAVESVPYNLNPWMDVSIEFPRIKES